MNNKGEMDEMIDKSEMNQMKGGRRNRGSKKRRGNASLRAWVTFVKKVQKEENISYKEAMMRAKKRKDKGEKWRGGARYEEEDVYSDSDGDEALVMEEGEMEGGRRRRRTRRRRSRKHGRKSRRHR
jgi:hypothetical protein